jgi:hypothetical protein
MNAAGFVALQTGRYSDVLQATEHALAAGAR